MRKLISTSVVAAALVAALSGVASAQTTTPTTTTSAIATQAAPDRTATNIGVTHVAPPRSNNDETLNGRTFRVNDANALTPEQMQTDWNTEIHNFFQFTPDGTGGA